MSSPVVKVKRETLKACMTCPLCDKLLKEATTISLCLHTFCRKCIYEKLSDEEVDCCPVCSIDLGCLPVEKLRPDHNLQDIRAKIFPLKRRKIEAPEVTHTNSLPVKRKERSLSSLVVSTPKVPMQSGLTGRRTKAARKASAVRGCSFAVEEPAKKEDSAGEHSLSSSSHDSQNKTSRNKRQDFSVAEPSNEQGADEERKNDVEVTEGKADLWTPLNCLVEAANRTKSSKLNPPGLSFAKSEQQNTHDGELCMPETKVRGESFRAPEREVYTPKSKRKEHGHKKKAQDENNGTSLLPGPGKRRRLRAPGRKSAAASGDLHPLAQVMLDAANSKHNRRNCPIWFTLVASEDRKADVSLPQISACYLRIKEKEGKGGGEDAAGGDDDNLLVDESMAETEAYTSVRQHLQDKMREQFLPEALIEAGNSPHAMYSCSKFVHITPTADQSIKEKDGKMPVSFIQKYLVKKLDLTSETEVEIMCRGQPVVPSLQLQNLVDLWFRTASTSKKVPASVGSSAKDFVMVLSYCRKVHTP